METLYLSRNLLRTLTITLISLMLKRYLKFTNIIIQVVATTIFKDEMDGEPPTYFCFLTIMGFHAFLEEKVSLKISHHYRQLSILIM